MERDIVGDSVGVWVGGFDGDCVGTSDGERLDAHI